MTRRAAAGALLVEKPQLARTNINCECAHTSVVLLPVELVDFVDRVEESVVWMDREKRRVLSLCCQPQRSESSGGAIEAKGVDTFALLAGVCADIHNELARRSWCSHRSREACSQEQE